MRCEFAASPITRDPTLFDRVRRLGADLTSIHLLEHDDIEIGGPAIDGDDRAVLEIPRYDAHNAEIQIAPSLVARNIVPAVWSYQQGAYPVVRNFLDARVGRTLSADEFREFRRLVAAVRLTPDRLPEIDQLVPDLASDGFPRHELGMRRTT